MRLTNEGKLCRRSNQAGGFVINTIYLITEMSSDSGSDSGSSLSSDSDDESAFTHAISRRNSRRRKMRRMLSNMDAVSRLSHNRVSWIETGAFRAPVDWHSFISSATDFMMEQRYFFSLVELRTIIVHLQMGDNLITSGRDSCTMVEVRNVQSFAY